MKRIFADTGYWIALFYPRDELHARAVAAAQSHSEKVDSLLNVKSFFFLEGCGKPLSF